MEVLTHWLTSRSIWKRFLGLPKATACSRAETVVVLLAVVFLIIGALVEAKRVVDLFT